MPPRHLRLACATAVASLLTFHAGAHVAVANQPAPTTRQANYEVRFLTSMIDHHMMAVMTGQLCQQRAVHPELLQLCENIVTTQMQEIQTMQSWLSDWYGISYTPTMKPGMQRHVDTLAQLSGAEFEVAFMTMMIRHHWKAVVKSSQCTERAYHAELISLCEDIMAAQSAEIIQMRQWLCEWYGVCRNGPGASITQ